jgi:hypothetical protein
MRSYEAGVYDIHDDGGQILKRAVPDPADLPDFVKIASMPGQDDNARLFALVMIEDGHVMKKFATASRGDTWLSALYFGMTGDALPEDAQKVAAANIIEACDHFEIAAPDYLFDLADGPVDTNIVDVTGARPKTKVASAATPQEGDLDYAITRADGSKYYPLKDATHVKAAMDYFGRNEKNFVPRERREFAVKTAAAARRGRLPLTDSIKKYAGSGWNPALEGHLTSRYLHLVDAESDPSVRGRLMKLASLQHQVEPEEFAEVLEVFDRELGLDALWDKELADPWFSAVGNSFEKIAKGAVDAPATYTVGETTVTQHEIEVLVERGLGALHKHFSHDFVNEFQKNPLPFFEALPLPQKKFIARLASSFQDVS